MIYLILSVLASSAIFVIFRLFATFKIDTFQAIVFNYFTAGALGFILFGDELKPDAFENLSWLPICFLCGVLFIFLFLIVGVSSQKNGVALTSVAIKMSMGMSMLLMISWYGESLTFIRISGILLAISGVILMSWTSNEKSESKPILWMLILLFVGGGALDFSLNYTQNHLLQNIPSSLFSAFGLFIAGCFGLLILLVQLARKKTQFQVKSMFAGLILGVPNYFSIFLLMESYSQMQPWTNSTVLAVTNVSVVSVSAFFGFVLFKERFSALKAFGLITSIAAIVLLYFSNL